MVPLRELKVKSAVQVESKGRNVQAAIPQNSTMRRDVQLNSSLVMSLGAGAWRVSGWPDATSRIIPQAPALPWLNKEGKKKDDVIRHTWLIHHPGGAEVMKEDRHTVAPQATQSQKEGCELTRVRLKPYDLLKLVFVKVPLMSQLVS